MADLGNIGIDVDWSAELFAEELTPLVFPDIAIPVPGGTTSSTSSTAGTVTFS